jgi:hypothetical protein
VAGSFQIKSNEVRNKFDSFFSAFVSSNKLTAVHHSIALEVLHQTSFEPKSIWPSVQLPGPAESSAQEMARTMDMRL